MNQRRLERLLRAAGASVIGEGNPELCELCGDTAELRPYGPGGKRICFPCGQKDPKTTAEQAKLRLGQEPIADVSGGNRHTRRAAAARLRKVH